MTVFKGYVKILKKNIGLVIMYLIIFFSVALALQAAAGKDGSDSYQSKSVEIGIVDEDGGTLAQGLEDYLGKIHHITMLENDREVLQENLFYRNVEYIVQIPENFVQSCILDSERLKVTKVPGSYTSYYVDQQTNSYLSMARTYLAAGLSQEEAVDAIAAEKHSEVQTLAGTSENVTKPGYLYYFRYLPYLFLGVFCYVMGYILMAFRQGDIQRRMEASAVSARRQSIEGLLAMGVMGLVLWGVGIAGAGIMYGKAFWKSQTLGYYILNSLIMMAVALSLSYLVGMFVKNSNMLSGLANVISLGMCFLCGVFVPMNVMDKKVLKVSQFLPVYWYEQVNELLSEYTTLTDKAKEQIHMAMGIEVLFVVVFVCLTLTVVKYKRQK